MTNLIRKFITILVLNCYKNYYVKFDEFSSKNSSLIFPLNESDQKAKD